MVFTEHSHYTKHDTKALLFLNVKFCHKVKLLPTCLIGDSGSVYFSFKLAMNVSFCQNVFLAC